MRQATHTNVDPKPRAKTKRPDAQPIVHDACLSRKLLQTGRGTQASAHRDRRNDAEDGTDDTATGRRTTMELRTNKTTTITCGEAAVRGEATTEAAAMADTGTEVTEAVAEAAATTDTETEATDAAAEAAAALESGMEAAAAAAAQRRHVTGKTTNGGTRRQPIYPERHVQRLR